MSDRDYLPAQIRNVHVMSWCPFCYLGWRPDSGRLPGTPYSACLMNLPTFSVQAHVPAIHFNIEEGNANALCAFMLRPKPWEINALMRAGIDPRLMRRSVPGLAEALAASRCAQCKLRRPGRCDEHVRPSMRLEVDA